MKKRGIWTGYLVFVAVWLYGTSMIEESANEGVRGFIRHSRIEEVVLIAVSCGLIYYLLTRQKQFEDKEREEQQLSTLINSMADFVNFKDGEGRWIQANEFGLKLFQLEHVNYRGKKDSELAEYTSFYKEALAQCEISDERTWQARKVTRCEEVVPLPDGGAKTFDTIKVPLFYEDGRRKALVVIGRDITERKLAEQKLSESEQRYKSLFEYNPDLVYMVGLDGRITNVNPQFEVFTGYKGEEFIGRQLFEVLHVKDQARVRNEFYKILETGMSSADYEAEIVRKDGTKINVRSTFVPMIIDNKMVGIIGYSKDVTKIKETEERLRRTEKLSVAGELAAGVAHEIRNPLTALKGFVQLLQQSDQGQQHYYEIMLNELDRINHIVGELLVLAKPQGLIFEKRNVASIMNDVIALLQSQANFYGAEISLKVQDDIPLIECEANQLKQLFINLIKNSFEADSTKIEIVLACKGEGELSIRITDNGCGIPKERMKHLGEPFFSYKEKGTGLGLTVSYRIVESHNGKIAFTSEVDKGTTVEMMFPIKKSGAGLFRRKS
ncbi:MAG: PAS domain S-box protein [Ectobacillus sp.]